MRIKDTFRFKPFSHTPGVRCLLPNTRLVYQIFPSRYVVGDEVVEISPLKKFTVLQDLERDEIVISGFSLSGFKRYVIKNEASKRPLERLTLGVDKSQEWSQVIRRGQMKEILPFWYWISQKVPKSDQAIGSAPSLFTKARNAKRDEVVDCLQDLFTAGFSDQLVPEVPEVVSK